MKELGVSPRAISLALVTDINGLFKPPGIQIFPYTKRCVHEGGHLLRMKERLNQPSKSLNDHLKSSLSLVLGAQVLGVNFWPARLTLVSTVYFYLRVPLSATNRFRRAWGWRCAMPSAPWRGSGQNAAGRPWKNGPPSQSHRPRPPPAHSCRFAAPTGASGPA